MYDPLTHIPLVVLRPGQTVREDIHAFTSSVDILPTVAHVTGHPIPPWVEGKLLPGLGGVEERQRSTFSFDAKYNSSFAPLVDYSASITRDMYRLIHFSYPKDNYEKFEFYNLDTDPQEMKDLYPSHPSFALEMKEELTQKINEANKAYRR
jgi:arylsulfatase A-like enzyme